MVAMKSLLTLDVVFIGGSSRVIYTVINVLRFWKSAKLVMVKVFPLGVHVTRVVIAVWSVRPVTLQRDPDVACQSL